MKNGEIDIKKLSLRHLEQYNDLLRYAFQLTDKILHDHGWESDAIRQSKFPVLERANVLGCFAGEKLISQVAVYPFEMNIHAAVYPVGFVTSVATYPEYSGQGLMSMLLKKSLQEMRERKQSLALLYPYSIPLYRRKGWEIISDKMSFSVPDSQIPRDIEVPGYVCRVPADSGDLINLHSCFAKRTHGCLLRSHLAWEEYWRWDVDDTTVAIYYGADGQPLAYMVYLIKEDIMYIKEMIYLNTEGRKGLWRFIGAHESMIERVRGSNYYSQPIAFTLENSEIKETICPYIMGRIVDAEAFLNSYHFQDTPDPAEITLCISDPLLSWNEGTFHLKIKAGRGILSTVPASNTASMSVGTLTALLLGYKPASELCRLEMIQADAETIRLLDRIVIHEKPYISDFV